MQMLRAAADRSTRVRRRQEKLCQQQLSVFAQRLPYFNCCFTQNCYVGSLFLSQLSSSTCSGREPFGISGTSFFMGQVFFW